MGTFRAHAVTFDWNIRITDIAIVIASILGPFFAVWVTERRREWIDAHNRKVYIFRTLMATRAAALSPAHIEALNLVEVDFNRTKPKERPVVEAWRLYVMHLNDRSYVPQEGWGTRRADLMIDLLHAMATSLDYSYEKSQIKTDAYYPSGYGETEIELIEIRKLFLEILRGKKRLPITAQVEGEDPETKTPVEAKKQ